MVFGGVYYAFFSKKDKARKHVNTIVEEAVQKKVVQTKKDFQTQQYVLKRKRKADQKPWAAKLDTKLEQANLLLKPQEFMMIQVACAVFLFPLPLIFGLMPLLALVTGALGYFAPLLWLKVKIGMRMAKAESMFPDVLEMMVSTFKSGYGFNKTTALVAEQFEDPWGTEFNKLTVEMNLGTSQEEALKAMAARVPTDDMKLFTAAMGIQKETGGNLVEILGILSSTIRDRFKLKSKVGALTAQGKLSGVIVFCVPFCLGGFIGLILPEIMINFINSPIGKVLLVVAGIMQCIGGIVLKKIVTIEV
jgi:tight adherence protein B